MVSKSQSSDLPPCCSKCGLRSSLLEMQNQLESACLFFKQNQQVYVPLKFEKHGPTLSLPNLGFLILKLHFPSYFKC